MSRKRKKASKESSSEDDSSSEDEKNKKKRKKERKRIKKEKRKKDKKDKKKRKNSESSDSNSLQNAVKSGPSQDRNKMCPMTKEEWEKQQSIVRRVYDEETGRSRLIKGDGEVLEEIVSKSRHQEINRKATMGDGLSFQSKIGLLKK